MEANWVAVLVALISGGLVTQVVMHFVNRPAASEELGVKRMESIVAGLSVLVNELQEERDRLVARVKEHEDKIVLLNLEIDDLLLRIRELEADHDIAPS